MVLVCLFVVVSLTMGLLEIADTEEFSGEEKGYSMLFACAQWQLELVWFGSIIIQWLYSIRVTVLYYYTIWYNPTDW